MKRPNKSCYACGTNDWWLRPDGGWACKKCHPNPNLDSGSNSEERKPAPEMVVISDQPGESHLVSSGEREYSQEALALRDRIVLGNKKLNDAYEQIKAITYNSVQWAELMEQWSEANKRLSALCDELKIKYNYNDCLYMENGVKTRKCYEPGDSLGCRVCPSEIRYWEKEFMEL